MATTKPEKNFNEFLPNGFATNSGTIKNDFSDAKKQTGFSSSVKDIWQGDNVNYMLDNIGKQLKYLTTVVDYITNIDATKPIPYINSNNKLDSGDINTFLPSQSGNNGKYLVTNGSKVGWGAIDTSNFANQSLSNLNSTGESRFNGKANISLNNLNSTGEARFNGKANISLDNLNSTGEARFTNLANRSLSNLSSSGENHFANLALTNLTQGFSSVICTTTPTTISSATSAKPAVVIENYVNGSSWYRVWFDGWLEQGGYYPNSNGNYTWEEVNLLKSFKNSNYAVHIQYINSFAGTSTSFYTSWQCVKDRTTNKFYFSNYRASEGTSWYACGQKG